MSVERQSRRHSLPVRPAVSLAAGLDVTGAVARLRDLAGDAGPLYYVYVVADDGRLVGVLSMRDLVLAPAGAPLTQVMRTRVETVSAAADHADVARVFRRRRLVALPAVDGEGRLLGVVTANDAMDAVEEDATEDLQRMVGAGAEERLTSGWLFSFRKRLPWLLVNLVLACVAASVIALFEDAVVAWTVLAMYLPVVAGMGGNASAQAMAVSIRGIAVEGTRRPSFGRIVARELRVGAASGLTTGVAAGVIALLIHRDHGVVLAALVAASLLVNHSVACVWGASIPFVMKTLGFDPAQSATIFTTTLTDMVGFFTLLGLATMVLTFGG